METEADNQVIIINNRISFLQDMIQKKKIKWLMTASEEEIKQNAFSLFKLCQLVIRNMSNTKHDIVNFSADTEKGSYMTKEMDIIAALIYNNYNNVSIDIYEKLQQIIEEYDVPKKNYSFFINMKNVEYPLLIRHYGEVTVQARLPTTYILEQVLEDIAIYARNYFALEEIELIGPLRSVRYKDYILSKFTNISIEDAVFKHAKLRRLHFVLNDAYSDLIRLSNVGQHRSREERVNWMQSIREKFSDSYKSSLIRQEYYPFVSDYEIEKYTQLFGNLLKGFNLFAAYLNNPRKEIPFGIKKYYIFNQRKKECNKTKVELGTMKEQIMIFYQYNKQIIGRIEDIHPDVIIGLYNLMIHIRLTNTFQIYRKDSFFKKVIDWITNPLFYTKPVLIKLIIKNAIDPDLHDLKEQGLLTFHQMEVLFGFRNSHLVLDEVRDDFRSWLDEGIEQFNGVQYEFIKKWAPEFFKYMNYQGKILGDIFLKNAHKYKDYEDLLGNISRYMTSKGSIEDMKFRVEGSNKLRSINKNQYFNLFKSQLDWESQKVRKITNNRVLIKYEEYIKQRIVINSTLNTFGPLSKLNKFVSEVTKGSGITYFSNTKNQKAEHYIRMQRYLMYNKFRNYRYLYLPLDYSSYDHTITMGFIRATLEVLGDYVGYGQEVRHDINVFLKYLSQEKLFFRELGPKDPINNVGYKYGMLSGWKITSSVESLGNAIITFGVMKELGLDLQDYETMGDDVIVILNKPNLSANEQKELLVRVCKRYELLGFRMNAPKNSVGYLYGEFLRVTFLPGQAQSYMARVLPGISVLKPGREEATFGVQEFQAVLKKITKRYGITSQYLSLAQYFSKNYIRKDIRQNAYKYIQNPYAYELIRKDKIDYKFKIDDIKMTPVFKRYKGLIGSDEYDAQIENYIDKKIVPRIVTYTYLKKRKDYISPIFSGEKTKIIMNIVNKFRRVITNDDFLVKKFSMPDYNLAQLMQIILPKKNRELRKAKELMFNLNRNLLDQKFIREKVFYQNNMFIEWATNINALRCGLLEDKVLSDESHIPSMILSRLKTNLINYIRMELESPKLDNETRAVMRTIINKNKDYNIRRILGILLSDRAETKLKYYLLPLSYRTD